MEPDDASQLIGAAHVIALNFQTIAAANDWWRHPSAIATPPWVIDWEGGNGAPRTRHKPLVMTVFA